MTSGDERELVWQAKQGNPEAFGELVKRHQTAVFNVAFRLLGRRRDAEDAAQEAFLRAYKGLSRFDETRPFAPWIKRITVNLCLNWLESARVKPQILATELARADEAAPDMDKWAHHDATPEQTMVKQERSIRLRESILTLPPHYRAVIELRHFQEMSYEEIATVMARPLSSVKSDLFRARKMLAQKMKEMA